jgi:hypothetical protein
MSCPSCASVNETQFTAEIMIHFSGLRSMDNPGLLAFPKVLVCLDCGFSRFRTTEAQLRLLGERSAASESAAA